MTLVAFFAALAVSVVLEHQARRHRAERSRGCALLNVSVPLPPPKLKKTEAWLNIALGLLIGVFGGSTAWMLLMRSALVREHGAPPGLVGGEREWEMVAVYGAIALSLVVLGAKALRENFRHAPGSSGGRSR